MRRGLYSTFEGTIEEGRDGVEADSIRPESRANETVFQNNIAVKRGFGLSGNVREVRDSATGEEYVCL